MSHLKISYRDELQNNQTATTSAVHFNPYPANVENRVSS